MKNIVIYHSADYDGILSGEAIRFWLEKTHHTEGLPVGVQMVGWDYGRPVPEKDDRGVDLDYRLADRIYIVDLSVDELMQRDELFGKIVWIDHHTSAIDKWASTPFEGVRVDGVAACRLCWQYGMHYYFSLKGVSSHKLPTKDLYTDRLVDEPLLIRLAGEYDIWDKRDPRADVLQLGLRALNKDQFDRLLHMSFTGSQTTRSIDVLDHPISLGNTIQSYVDSSNKSAMKNSHTVKWRGVRFLVCNGVRGSLSFKSHVTSDHDALMAWGFDGKQATVSLYGVEHRPDIDLSDIAKAMGGGGHRQACGFRVSLTDLQFILSN